MIWWRAMKNPTISRTQRTPFGVLFALVAERALPLSRPLTAALRRRREWVGKQKRHSAAFLRSRNRQIKEPQEQFIIATHGDYDLVEGNEKSHNFPNAKDTIRCPFCVGCGAGFAPFTTFDSRSAAAEGVGSAAKNTTVWCFLQALSPKQGAPGESRRPTQGDYATGLGYVCTNKTP